MPRRALMERRPWLLGSLAAAILYYLLRDGPMPGLYLIGWKGAAVGMLAIYALLRVPGGNARILAAAMVLAACADMAMELDAFWAGLFILASQFVLIALFLRNRRAVLAHSQKLAALALLLLTPLITHALLPGDGQGGGIVISGLAMGAMAGTAWASRFPRYRTGAGAVLAVSSFLLIQAGDGPLSGSPWPHTLAWPLYYAGQFLICTGVTLALRQDHRA